METLPPNPGFPPCLVCGIGFAVTRTDVVVTLPGNSYQTCATIAPMTGELCRAVSLGQLRACSCHESSDGEQLGFCPGRNSSQLCGCVASMMGECKSIDVLCLYST